MKKINTATSKLGYATRANGQFFFFNEQSNRQLHLSGLAHVAD